MATNSPLTLYRQVLEGAGGTLIFRDPTPYDHKYNFPDNEALHHVGTRSLMSRVGVYFKIKATKAFCAHIDAMRDVPGKEHGYPFITDSEGQRLKQQTIDRLQKDARKHKWQAADVVRTSVILVSPNEKALPPGRGYSPPGHLRGAIWVIEGIKEFLGLPNLEANTENEGVMGAVSPTPTRQSKAKHQAPDA